MGASITLQAVPYYPAMPLAGGESSVIFRGKNMVLRGNISTNLFYEVYAGSENLNEPLPEVIITGTLAFDPTSTTIVGAGTQFLDELHPGQMIRANEEYLTVLRLIDDTHFINGRLPVTTETTAAGYRPYQLFALDINRGAQLTGNALHFDKGTILSVGQGVLYKNGAVLPGDSLTATRQPQVALYDASTMTYDVQDIGFSAVPIIDNTDVSIVASGGVENMSLGYYSFRLAYYSTVTGGYGNPTDVLLSGGTTGYNVTVVNSTFDFDLTGDTPPPKADGYIVYGNAFAGSSDNSKLTAIQGGWFQIKQPIPFTDLVAGHIILEYVDADLSTLVSFDNDQPPDAEFYATLDRYPFLISTNGPGVGSGSRMLTTSPGPFVSPIKAENFDAYPNTFKVPTEKGENILGVVSAAGRIFVLTPNTLQAVTPTGLPSAPFTCRPFWKRGFQGNYNLCFVDDTLYGFTTAGAFRSIATGDEGAESHEFASNVETQMASWHGAYVFVAHDPKNEQICFFYSASRMNNAGFWETDILPFSLRQGGQWLPTIVLSDDTRDMVVSGAATVGGHLEFIAGGRREDDTPQWQTWRYDTATGTSVPYYLTWNYQDNGVELTAKTLRKLRPKGKFTEGAVQLYLAQPDNEIDIADLETGSNATFEISLLNSDIVKQYGIIKCRARNGMMWTARIEGTWDGIGMKDQFHELALLADVSGQER